MVNMALIVPGAGGTGPPKCRPGEGVVKARFQKLDAKNGLVHRIR